MSSNLPICGRPSIVSNRSTTIGPPGAKIAIRSGLLTTAFVCFAELTKVALAASDSDFFGAVDVLLLVWICCSAPGDVVATAGWAAVAGFATTASLRLHPAASDRAT